MIKKKTFQISEGPIQVVLNLQKSECIVDKNYKIKAGKHPKNTKKNFN
jgi:hypothetical protein